MTYIEAIEEAKKGKYLSLPQWGEKYFKWGIVPKIIDGKKEIVLENNLSAEEIDSKEWLVKTTEI